MSEQQEPFRERGPIENGHAERLLTEGTIEILGRMPWSSNATLLCDVIHDDQIVQAIYKPHRGEKPLWDFPSGLYRREVACYELAKALGWDIVPPTVLVEGPVGLGSLQLFVPCDFSEHYFTVQNDPALRLPFEQLVALDIAANSTDRKSGHVLIDDQRHIWAIDNGLSFHEEFKLRTVLWDFAGEPLPESIVTALTTLLSRGLTSSLAELVDEPEIEAAETRIRSLLTNARFPKDPTGRRWPWPLV